MAAAPRSTARQYRRNWRAAHALRQDPNLNLAVKLPHDHAANDAVVGDANLGVYLGLVLIVVVAGLSVAVLGQRQLRDGIRSADLALAQSIALDLDDRLRLARNAVLALSSLEPVTRGDAEAARAAFKTFKAARPKVDRVYWLDNSGRMALSEPFDVRTIGADYSEQPIFLRARTSPNLFVEAGAVDLTTYNPVAIVVQTIYAPDGVFVGALASNLSLDDISAPIRTIVADQERQGVTMRIEVLNAEGTVLRVSRVMTQSVQPGENVLVAVRSERVRHADSSVNENIISGRIVSSDYLGSKWQHTVETAAGSMRIETLDAVDELINVHLPPDSLILLKE
jgi:hypothetical protein